ncbi:MULTISPECIES: helix-turn-helix transcriptional regulator [unclassified Lacticaseibacillus]|uniref:helix-turn-helix domain-containing protein n=1 Tax=unclassified Lacticaseibacillus TaxID=2759744 RepID=UPI00194419E9|nr:MULTISPECIES: helix-turn-helix transcriptional regulator [unclassified Lacticaseibacillus]
MATWKNFESKMDEAFSSEELEVIDTLAALHSERIRQGLSQHDLAQKIGMKQPQLAKIERMDSLPSLRTLDRYATGLGLKLKLLVTHE